MHSRTNNLISCSYARARTQYLLTGRSKVKNSFRFVFPSPNYRVRSLIDDKFKMAISTPVCVL